MKKKYGFALFLLGFFALLQVSDALACGLGGVKKGKAVDPDEETAMSDVESKTELG
ncbi:MAG TPA: hypothetical protein VL404_02730 [Candidatus Eisenbacteria bacterium]|jgi:hypothetical protein|nr:hypothetical protein [Candidatus Eisenbacteria bacterium]